MKDEGPKIFIRNQSDINDNQIVQFQGIGVPLEAFEKSKRGLFEEFDPETDDHREYWLDHLVEKDIQDYEKQGEDTPWPARYPTWVWDFQVEKLRAKLANKKHILRAIGAQCFNLETRTTALVAYTMTQSIATQGAQKLCSDVKEPKSMRLNFNKPNRKSSDSERRPVMFLRMLSLGPLHIRFFA